MWKTVNLLILCAVSLPQSIAQSKTEDDTRWSWGVADVPVTANTNRRLNEETSTSTTEFYKYDPCADYNPPTPNFRAPGRRLNEEISLPNSIAQSKTEDDTRWSWGFADVPVTANTNRRLNEETSTSTTEFYKYDPCADYSPPTPNFRAPGRRLNEEKCEEYIYNVKLEEEKSDRAIECSDLNNNGESGFFPQAVGGRDAKPLEFPHMGAIGWRGVTGEYVFKCGSTLISPKFVLTAAHCIRAPVDSVIDDPDPKIVRLRDGNLFKNPGGFPVAVSPDKNISRIIVHPQYKPPKKYFDIALMELDSVVTFSSKVRPACLWNRPDTGDFGKEASLTGWGVLAQGSLNISPNLQAADVDIIDSEQCDQLLKYSRNRHWQGLTDNQLCAGRLEGGVDACQGDSGGPLQFRRPLHLSSHGNIYYVIGVTSFGIGCALPNHPGIYTRVSSFVDWIEEHVWK